MGTRRRLLAMLAAVAAAMLSAGGAWAASGHPSPFAHGLVGGADVTDSSSSSSSSEVTDSSSSSSSSTTDTEVHDDTTTSSVEPETSSSVPEEGPKAPGQCKPGWGYGDKNHCHSGPPGLNKPKHGHHG